MIHATQHGDILCPLWCTINECRGTPAPQNVSCYHGIQFAPLLYPVAACEVLKLSTTVGLHSFLHGGRPSDEHCLAVACFFYLDPTLLVTSDPTCCDCTRCEGWNTFLSDWLRQLVLPIWESNLHILDVGVLLVHVNMVS